MTWFWAFKICLSHELRCMWEQRQHVVLMIGFYSLIMGLFGLCLSHPSDFLSVSISWIIAITVYLLSLPEIWQANFESGVMEVLIARGFPLTALIWAKWIRQTIVCIIVFFIFLIIGSVCLGHAFTLKIAKSIFMTLPLLTWQGLLISGLSLGAASSIYQSALLVLPLSIPALLVFLIHNFYLDQAATLITCGILLCITPIYTILLSWILKEKVSF